MPAYRSHGRTESVEERRIWWVAFFFIIPLLIASVRLGYLQIMRYGFYSLYASDQHDLEKKILPKRGQILIQDPRDKKDYPLASNELAWQIYASPRDMKDRVAVAKSLAPLLKRDEADLIAALEGRPEATYVPLVKDADADLARVVREAKIPGIGFVQVTRRLYPERGLSGQVIGFVSAQDGVTMTGKYGVEYAMDGILAGKVGHLLTETDASGRKLIFAKTAMEEAVHGSDIVLTLDRNIQHQACRLIAEAVARHQADGGSILVVDPNSGAIMAMCSAPDFESSQFREVKDLATFNNPATFVAYEPGSIFKAFTVAAGLDADVIGPKTTYTDTGEEKIDDFTIRNSDKKAHGVQTMTQALDESLNTAMIYIQRLLGKQKFKSYVEAFGFGAKTGIELRPEVKGDISNLSRKGSVFAATGSFGQGLTATPIQLAAAYAALANGGTLYRPFLVKEIRHPDGRQEVTKPQAISQPITRRASRLVTGMLISAVENGHGKKAGVPGYWVAGKTGTAQIPRSDGVVGYEKDATIGSFAGFAPAHDPKFVMVVKIVRPRDVQWAESSAAPLFGDMAKFLLSYLQIRPDRPILPPTQKPLAPAPEFLSPTGTGL